MAKTAVQALPAAEELFAGVESPGVLESRVLAERLLAAALTLPGVRAAELHAPGDAAAEVVASAGKRPGGKRPREPLALPVVLDGAELGALVLYPTTRASAERLRERAAGLLPAAAPVLAARRVTEVQRQLTFAEAIIDIGQALTEVMFLDEVLLSMIRLGEALAQAHYAAVGVVSESDQDSLQMRFATGALHPLQGTHVPLDGSFMGWIVRNEAPDLTPCLADDPRSYPDGVRAGPAAAVPIRADGRVIGAFLVARMEGFDPLTQTDLRILEKLAAFAAVAVQNARLYSEQKDSTEMLREQAAELQSAYERLSASQEQLLVSEKMAALGRITAGIAHEINSPLSSILNSIRSTKTLIAEYRVSVGDPDVTPDDHKAIALDMEHALELAQGATTRLGQFVRSIKLQTRAGGGASSEFDPAEEIGTTLIMLHHELKRRKVAVFTELERERTLSGDAGQFGMIVQNLLSNAIDAYDGRGGEVWVRLREEDDALVLEVEDHGCGIPEEIRGRVFDYMFTTKDVGKGTGLGLAMVHNLVHSVFGGSVRLESEVGRGTLFHITFPLNAER